MKKTRMDLGQKIFVYCERGGGIRHSEQGR